MKKGSLNKVVILALVVLFTGFCLWGCSTSSGVGGYTGGGGSTYITVYPSGGNYVTQSGKVSLLFPANALDQTMTFTVTPNSTIASDSETVPGTTYDFAPSKSFLQPVQLTIAYTASSLGGIREDSLKLYRRQGSAWTEVSGSTVNTTSKTVSGYINGFSTYGIRGGSAASAPLPGLGNGTITGSVKDAVSGSPVAGASIAVIKDGTTVAAGVTLADGSFLISPPAGNAYKVVFSHSNYATDEYYNVSVSGSETVYLETVRLIYYSHAYPGALGGVIMNALNGTGVGGLNVNIRRGINVQSGTVLYSASTQSDGSYSFPSLSAGNYTAEISGSGYVATYVTLVCIGGTTTLKDATISPNMSSDQTRIVLTWGASPKDIDLHLTGPAVEGSRFHVYWANRNYLSYVNLDLDDTSSYGPETITISRQESGVYRCSVNDFTSDSGTSTRALANSGAQVKVYRGGGLAATFNVPSREGTWWVVFELNGDLITPINTMSYDESSRDIAGLLSPLESGFYSGHMKDRPVGK
jgi:hypothetical protein